MKTILCYGDSNTWGYNPASGQRFSEENRWPGVLAGTLGTGYRVLAEGLNGRTTVWDDPIELHKNGASYLPPCLESHKPLDMVVIMLGTNDLKVRFGVPACDIAGGAGVLVDIARGSACGPGGTAPQVLLIAPPPVSSLSGFAEAFEGAEEKSARFAPLYEAVARSRGVGFLDAGSVVVSSTIDGIHLELDQQRALGEAIATVVARLL